MNDNRELSQNTFEMEINAPCSLNYLIFVQNIYLNKTNENEQKPTFPYVDGSNWGPLEEKKFPHTYKEVWNKVIHTLSQNGQFDHNGILYNENALFRNLFETNKYGNFGLHESVKSFSLVGWNIRKESHSKCF